MADLKGKIKEITTTGTLMTILGAAATPAMPETTKEEIKAKSAALNKNPRRVECFRCACFAVLTAI